MYRDMSLIGECSEERISLVGEGLYWLRSELLYNQLTHPRIDYAKTRCYYAKE